VGDTANCVEFGDPAGSGVDTGIAGNVGGAVAEATIVGGRNSTWVFPSG
jgi:hypothetical protein